ncbi:GGDEF domain-containing protein [Terrisporobacter mayombei]|nr:GGDEF domain-containing protein [Terrisporobacter mayombei]
MFKNLSVTDPLTNMANRRALDEFLAWNWVLYKETKMPISFMMIDIDFFKLYNDNYGHLKGDEVLILVASYINASCEKGDFVARYGGEEFIVIMLNKDKKEAMKNANNIMQNIYHLNIKHEFSSVSDRLTLSMGITTAHIGTTKEYEDYIKKADEALYEAKQYGRNKYIFIE